MNYDVEVNHGHGNEGERVCTTVRIDGPDGPVRVRFRIDKETIEDKTVHVEGTTFLEFFWTMAPGDNKVDVQVLEAR